MTYSTAIASPRPSFACLLALASSLALLTACNRPEPASDTGDEAPAASAHAADGQSKSAGKQDEQVVLYYYDPMRPEVRFDKPGKSPFMDMELVPKYAEAEPESAAGPARGVAVSAAIVQTLGIRVATPSRADVRPSVRVPARVVADARGQARLQARVSGWVERLLVRSVGQSVSAGSVVAEIYSPELIQAQEELLLGAGTAGPATERLRRFGIADSDIQAIRRAGKASRRLPLRAPVSGVVTELGVREGSSISPETLIVDLSARSAVWIEAQLFPAQLIRLGNGYSARFTLPGVTDREWRSDNGTPVALADPITQALAVRFPISDANGLVLGTVLDAEIEGATRSGVLLVPASAVIRTAQGDRVLMEHGKNNFMPMPVKLGEHYGDQVEVVEGLGEQDRIVVSGQFLLDAEASQQSGLKQMNGGMSGTKP